MNTFKLILLFWGVIIISSCNNSDNPYCINYDESQQRLYFTNDESFNEVEIYWRDSLLINSGNINSINESDTSYISTSLSFDHDLFAENPSLLIEICYNYFLNQEIPLRYVFKNYINDKIVFDTTIVNKNIIPLEYVERHNNHSINDFPVFNFENTGFSRFTVNNYYTYVKSQLYKKNIFNVDEDIINKTATAIEIFDSKGYQIIYLSINNTYFGKVSSNIPIQVSNNASMLYLVLANIAGLDGSNDLVYKTEETITDFVAREYSHNFKNATINKGSFVNVPVSSLDNQNRNKIQVLFVVEIFNDNSFKYIPIGYVNSLGTYELLSSPLGILVNSIHLIQLGYYRIFLVNR